jgi:hypothetical protein
MYFCLKDAPGSKKAVLVQYTNPSLRHLMTALIQDDSSATEDNWARYFLKNLIEISDIFQFLLANSQINSVIEISAFVAVCSYQLLFSYLQLICYYSAKQISDRLQSSAILSVNYPLEECFIIACEATLKPTKLLKNFNFKDNFPVHSYAKIALNRTIQNQIVKEQKNRTLKFSDNGLLRQLSATQLEKALKEYGICQQEIVNHRLVWQAYKDSFNEMYSPVNSNGKRNINFLISSLNEQQLHLIAQRYNQLRDRSHLETQTINIGEIEKLLTTCIQASRRLENRKFISLEERWDIVDVTTDSLDILINQETQQELVELENIIIKEFESIDELSRKSLLLWLGLGIHQNDFLTLFNLSKQYQVTRHFQCYLKKILINVLHIYYQQKRMPVLMDKEMGIMCISHLNVLKDYLTRYSYHYFVSIIEKTTQGKKIINYNQHLLETEFTQAIEKKLEIQLQQLASTQQNIAKFVERWLQQNQVILFR